ncbi:MAG TPA: VOC family protein [Alphaproteobacteria bacterium]|nr:VOC family protein [Alphaproteobacteria bacterium]
MLDHIGLHVKDLRASIKFYQAALAALGHGLTYEDGNGAGFGPAGGAGLWLYVDQKTKPRGKPMGVHVAFAARDRAAVDAFHKAGLKSGGADNGKPGLRADYSPTYYAAFLIDPDGNNVEAVCLK